MEFLDKKSVIISYEEHEELLKSKKLMEELKGKNKFTIIKYGFFGMSGFTTNKEEYDILTLDETKEFINIELTEANEKLSKANNDLRRTIGELREKILCLNVEIDRNNKKTNNWFNW